MSRGFSSDVVRQVLRLADHEHDHDNT